MPQPTPNPSQSSPMKPGSKLFGIIGFVLSLLALFASPIILLSLIFIVGAIVLGSIGLSKQYAGRGFAIAAIVIAGVTLILLPVVAIIVALASESL